MLETFRYDTERRLTGTGVFAVLVSLYAGFAVALFPSVESSSVDLQRLVEAYPEPLREALGMEAIGTIEGFLVAEFYNFVWVLLLGVYFAYRAGGLIASDIERGRMDLLLSLPLSRTQLLFEKYAALAVPIVVINVVAALTIYASTVAIGHSVDPVGIGLVHLLSIPYLLICSAIGLVVSVVIGRAEVAQRVALITVFALYLLESLAGSTQRFEELQSLSPTQYYDPTAILVDETYALADAGVLLIATVVLLLCSRLLFNRRDI